MAQEQGLETKTGALSLQNPNDIMGFANILQQFIKKSGLSTKIGNSEYVNVDGWKFAGMNFGLVGIPTEPIMLHTPGEAMHVFYEKKQGKSAGGAYTYDKVYMATQLEAAIELEKTRCSKFEIHPVYKYKCQAEIINLTTGQRVNFGSAVCTNLEVIKAGFDEYAVASMAQTRAIGKGFRNLLGFVMNAAGFEPTPAEEMGDEKYTKQQPKGVVFDTEVASQIVLIADLDGLEKYWNQLPELHKDKGFIAAINARKAQLKPATA